MDKFISVFILVLGLSGSLALHIVMSPEEAEKIMKREDEFSKGLAGFVDKKLSANPKKSGSKDATIEKIKRLLTEKLGGLSKVKKDSVSVEIKKSAPPALPLDAKKEDSMASLEQLVDKLVKEVDDKQKRSCSTYKCFINHGREVEHAKEAENGNEAKKSTSEDSLDRIYQSVKRLVEAQKKESVTSGQSSETVVSDSGDVGDRMLAKVKDLIKKKSQGIKPKIFEDPSAKSDAETRSNLEAKVDKLLHKVSQLTRKDAKKDAGDLALDAMKELIAKKKEASKVTENKDSLNDIKRELAQVLKRLSSGKNEIPPHANDVTSDDAAIEKNAKRAATPKNDNKRRQMIEELLKTYDEMTRRKDAKRSDVYANELENASRKLKRSNAQAELIKGFEQRDEAEKIHKSHPK